MAATQVVDATVAEVNDRGFVLTVGTEPLAVVDESTTRFWRAKAPSDRGAFKVGDQVRARLKTDAAPTLVREMADRATAAWLDRIRKEPMSGTVKKVDAKYVTLAFEDGSTFAYRATDRSDVTIGGAKIPATDLKEGAKVWAKGRTLPTLDTWLVTLTDKPIIVTKKTEKKPAKPKVTKLGNQGVIKGTVDGHKPTYQMFDVIADGRWLHITYNAQTKFLSEGRTVDAKSIVKGWVAQIIYTRDRFGRIIATKVELFSSPTT